jgi:lipoprotein-releasing system permease protein
MLRSHEYVADNILEGSLDDFGGRDTIAVGIQLAQTLGVRVGDQITLISPEGTATPFGTAPRMQAYRVVALFEVGIYDYDAAFVFMPLESAQIYYRLYDAASAIEVFVEHPDDITEIAGEMERLAEGQGYVRTWQQMNMSLFSALVVERNVMFIILTMIILVAVFNIISSLIILVKDKSKDIAIMRTMGAGRRSMMKIFMISGAAIGFAGTLLGVALGVLIVINIQPIQDFIQSFFNINLWPAEVRFLSEMPAELKFSEVALVVVISFLLSFLATLPPSWRAANLDPVEILRHEA